MEDKQKLSDCYTEFEMACEIGYKDNAIRSLERYLDMRTSLGIKENFSIDELT